MTAEIYSVVFVSLKQRGKNEMLSFHYANFAGSLVRLMNCYSICRWTPPTSTPQIWHMVITCPIFLCYIVSSSAHRSTAHKIETKVPKGFSLRKVKSVSSSQARTWETNWGHLLSFKQSERLGGKQESLLPLLSYSSDQARPLLPFCVGFHLENFTWTYHGALSSAWLQSLPGSYWNWGSATEPVHVKGNMLSAFSEI